MGLSTFIEINNDFADEIQKNPEGFAQTLLTYLYTGDKNIYIPAVSKKITLHRDDKKCQNIQKLLSEGL